MSKLKLALIGLFLVVCSPSLAVEPVAYSVRVDGAARDYLLYRPVDVPKDKALPVVLMLHGGGGHKHSAASNYGWVKLADEKKFVAVFPEGSAGKRTLRASARFWNEGSGRVLDMAKAPDDVAYLRAVLDDVAKQTAIDEKRVFVTGFSMGASMTWRVGVEMADRVTAIAPVSGHLWLEEKDVA